MTKVAKLLLEDPLGLIITLLRAICFLGFPVSLLLMVITTDKLWAIIGLSSIASYVIFSFIMFELIKRTKIAFIAIY